MTDKEENERPTNPKKTANIFSKATFIYILSLFKTGYRRKLQDSDIYNIPEEYSSRKTGNELEKQWKLARKRHPKPSLYGVLWRSYGKTYLLLGIMQFIIKTITLVLYVIAIQKIVAHFKISSKRPSVSTNKVIIYATALVLVKLFNAFYTNNYRLALNELGMKVRTGLCSLIFRKCLRLSPSAMSEFSTGRIVTMMTKDVYYIDQAVLFLNEMWIGLVHLGLMGYLICSKIGLTAFTGIGFIVFTMIVEFLVGKLVVAMRLKTSKQTDLRIQTTNEMLSAVKMVKLCSWVTFFKDRISSLRTVEIKKLRIVFYLKVIIACLGSMCTKIAFYIFFLIYVNGSNFVQVDIIYFVSACFQNLTMMIISIPFGIVHSAELHAAVKRITKLLLADELSPDVNVEAHQTSAPSIKLKDVSVEIQETAILRCVNLELKKGLNLIIGNLGHGKSSLLKTILREYPITDGEVSVKGSVSYASEDPWLFPATIRNNIIFGQPFNKLRYRSVLEVCDLIYDLNFLANGDQTVIGDRGLNLSRGQQSRINLARALYNESDIYLIDDCLSSLDPNVQEHVFNSGIKNFLKDKLVVMISNNRKFLESADNIIHVEKGTVKVGRYSGPESGIISKYIEDLDEIDKTLVDNSQGLAGDSSNQNYDSEADTLLYKQTKIYQEDTKTGVVKWDIYKKYLQYAGALPVRIFLPLVFLVTRAAISYNDKLVREWVNNEEKLIKLKINNSENSTEYKEILHEKNSVFTVYTSFIIISIVLTIIRAFTHYILSTRISTRIHKAMITNVAEAKMEFFDTHLIGNILNRFSKDMAIIDEKVPMALYESLRIPFIVIFSAVLVGIVGKALLVPIGILFLVLYVSRKLYLRTGRSLQRIECSTRSPVLGYVDASLEGIVTIRSSNRQEAVLREYEKHQDLYTSAFYMTQIASRAFIAFIDLICAIFVAAILIQALTKTGITAGDVGLVLSQVIMMTTYLELLFQYWAELETLMTSTERALQFTSIRKENNCGSEIEDWPNHGSIEFKDVSLTYKKTNETVLKNICFKINAREKVGIIGRTGAGKSSIISVLCRLYDSEGEVTIDDVNTNSICVDYLRSKIAVIPQNPLLFTGSVRSNIDPFNVHEDSEIWMALDTLGLKSLVNNLADPIKDNAARFSSGQKQLLCLARALIQKNKIIILDEATGNMDVDTDKQIQAILQEKFASCTVLTIAHRLTSVINSDKIMVVDQGTVVEFDEPDALLRDKSSRFYSLLQKAQLLAENSSSRL